MGGLEPEDRPGSPELLRKVQQKLQSYYIAKQLIEDMKTDFGKLNLDVSTITKIINKFPRFPDYIIDEIMSDLYVLVSIHQVPDKLAKPVSEAMTKYVID
jgi:hypothetical protein